MTDDEVFDLIDASEVYSTTLSRYYTPDIYEEVGFEPFISINENLIDLQGLQTVQLNLYTEQQITTTYWFKWIDTSQFSLIDFGEERIDYKVERQTIN